MINQRDPLSSPTLIKELSLCSDYFFKENFNFIDNINTKNPFNEFKHFTLNRSRILKPKDVHLYAKTIFLLENI
jgi:hypothetical protein